MLVTRKYISDCVNSPQLVILVVVSLVQAKKMQEENLGHWQLKRIGFFLYIAVLEVCNTAME